MRSTAVPSVGTTPGQALDAYFSTEKIGRASNTYLKIGWLLDGRSIELSIEGVAVRDLNFGLKQLSERNKDGSFATRANRDRMLSLIAEQLWEEGFKKMTPQDLGGRHVNRLIERWQREGLAAGTVKNRMAALRWWAEKVGRDSVIHRDNDHYGIEQRRFVTNESKARELPADALAKVTNPYVRMSLELQREFGLRREEAIKFQPRFADRETSICLKASWTKGGKPREIPVLTASQREVLDRAHKLAGSSSLIPPDMKYIQQVKIYERQALDAGLNKMHGLRHCYAQRRYAELTGWPAPAVGGPTSKQLTSEQKVLDRGARLIISKELGHEREQITAVYLGR